MKKLMLISVLATIGLFASNVEITDIYASATPPHTTTSAVFMKIKNNTDRDIYLLGGNSNVSKTTEVHQHIHSDGMMKMVKASNILIPAHGSAELKPGGYHVMLIGLNKALKPDEKIDLKLDISTNQDDKNPQIIDIKNIVVKKFHTNTDMKSSMHKHCGCKHHKHTHNNTDMKMHMDTNGQSGCLKPNNGSIMGTCGSK